MVRGAAPGPVVGVLAALHGNELNGIPVIHEVVRALDPGTLCGAVVAVPVVNLPGYLLNRREFLDGVDLNRVFPGREGGTPSQVFVARLLDRVVSQFTHMLELHTASFGRVNCIYARADLNDPVPARMARLQSPEVLLHNFGTDGTLRSAAAALGIHAVTVEIGNPQRFQAEKVASATRGVLSVLADLGVIPSVPAEPRITPVVCARSSWLYTRVGGVLEVLPGLLERLDEGQIVARVSDLFGTVLEEYHAPEAGIVIGRSTNPVAPTGSRIVHLGVQGDPAAFRRPSVRQE